MIEAYTSNSQDGAGHEFYQSDTGKEKTLHPATSH